MIYRLRFPCCGNRRRRPAQVRGPSLSPGRAWFLRSRSRRSPPHRHGSGAWCRWAGTLPHIYGISASNTMSHCSYTLLWCFSLHNAKTFFFQIQLLSYIPGWGSWVSSKRERSGRWARRWQLWQAWRWVQTRTEKCIWLHPATSGQRCCCLSESRQTEQKPDRYSRVDRYK